MKKIIFFILFQTICAAGFSQALSLKDFGIPFQRTNLVVRWKAPANAYPPKMWVYHLLPNHFSPEIISNLMVLTSFTDPEKTDRGTNGIVFKARDGARSLWVSFPLGSVEYQTMIKYSPTNLVKDVPDEKQAVELMRKLLPKLGVRLSDIEKKENSSKPQFNVGDSEIMFFINHATISNTVSRGVSFRRSVDGAAFVGYERGGSGAIDFGDHGKIIKISLSWRNLARDRCYPTATPETIMNRMRQGQAVQHWLLDSQEPIDWATVKSVTVKRADPCYYAGDMFAPSDWLYPFVSLWTTIDTGHGNVDVEIECPIFDEAKP